MGLKRIWKKVRRKIKGRAVLDVRPLSRRAIREADAIITTNEVTDRHGTGVILRRIFGQSPNILSIRSTKLYPEHALGQVELCLNHEGLSRPESFARVLAALNGNSVGRVLCVPFLPDELITAIVLRELFKVPLCVFLMDDNNIYARGIPDDLMREALEKASLRLAISPELRDAYEEKYHQKFWVVPPVVDEASTRSMIQVPSGSNVQSGTGVLIGSLWSRAWLESFRQTVQGAGLQVHWYGNTKAPWLKVTSEELRQDGIIDCGFIPESELTERLKDYLYAMVPSGTLDKQDDRPEIAQLSLPTRLPYLLAAVKTPVIVLGNPKTAAARFLQRFPIGKVVPYNPDQLRAAVDQICQPESQRRLRLSAAEYAPIFSAKGLADWVWQSLEKGEAQDDRFEIPFRRGTGEIVQYLDGPAPKDLHGDFALVYLALRRLRRKGFVPDFVVDVGSSTGVWSDAAKRVFPEARFILVDPLHDHYLRANKWYYECHPDFEAVSAAISDRPGVAELSVSPDLYGSSLLQANGTQAGQKQKVPIITLDQLARDKKLSGRGLVKVDAQFTEHLVLAGGKQMLQQVDALLLELSLFRYAPEARLFPEMCDWVRSLGFNYYEDVGGWRSPVDGTTLQKDVLFVRDALFTQGSHQPVERSAGPAKLEPEAAPEPVGLVPASVE